jgi:hypothetical protein
VKRPDGTRIPTGSPKEFRECITGDVFAVDSFTYEAVPDGGSDFVPSPGVDPDLTNVAAVGIWNESGATMLRKCARDHDINDLALVLLQDTLSIVPDQCELTYATSSEWLLGQWNDMVEWQSIGYQGLDRAACPYQWKGIMEHVETRLSKVTMIRLSDTQVIEGIHKAVWKFGNEGIDWYTRFMETPDGAEYPPVAPLR